MKIPHSVGLFLKRFCLLVYIFFSILKCCTTKVEGKGSVILQRCKSAAK